MEAKKRKLPWDFLTGGLFLVLGILVILLARAYQFSGLLTAALGCVVICYAGIRRLGAYHVNGAKALRILLTCLLFLVGLAALFTGTRIAWSAEGHSSVNCRYVVVLGAGVDGDVPSMSLRERLDAAYHYLATHPTTVCVVSGGQGGGESITEAECMYRDLVRRGIDPERIWKEENASTTAENLRFSLDLIEKNTGKRPTQIGLVSSEYHLYRAERIADGLGISAVGIPAHTVLFGLRCNYFLREIAAVWYYAVTGGIS